MIDDKEILNFTDEQKEELSLISKQIKKMSEQVYESIKPVEEIFETKIKPITDEIKKMTSSFNFDVFNDLLKYIKGSPLSDDEKILANVLASKYAQYGIVYLFDNHISKNNVDAIDNSYDNEIFDSYSKGEKFNELIECLYKLKYQNKQQIHEAIECYNKELYYACCSILFEIIIRQITSSQEIQKKKNGKSARRPFYDSDKCDKHLNLIPPGNHFFIYVFKLNFIYLYSYYFKGANNFESENFNVFPVINRNFIAHGMSNRNIDKYDCIKLIMFIYAFNYEYDDVLMCVKQNEKTSK